MQLLAMHMLYTASDQRNAYLNRFCRGNASSTLSLRLPQLGGLLGVLNRDQSALLLTPLGQKEATWFGISEPKVLRPFKLADSLF